MARPMTKRPSAKQMTTNTKVVCTALYIRVSTDAQAKEGYSLEAQRDRLNSHCKAQQWSVCENHIYIDAGISGTSTTGRAALAGMMEAARRGEIDRIVAVKLDRLARNV